LYLYTRPSSKSYYTIQSSLHRNTYIFFNSPATTEFYTTRHTLSLHDALPIFRLDEVQLQKPDLVVSPDLGEALGVQPRSEEHTSELQSRLVISYAVFCLK